MGAIACVPLKVLLRFCAKGVFNALAHECKQVAAKRSRQAAKRRDASSPAKSPSPATPGSSPAVTEKTAVPPPPTPVALASDEVSGKCFSSFLC